MGDQRQVERLGVDRQAVPAEPDGGAAVLVQVEAVAQRAGRGRRGRGQRRVEFGGPRRVAQGAQLRGDPPVPRPPSGRRRSRCRPRRGWRGRRPGGGCRRGCGRRRPPTAGRAGRVRRTSACLRAAKVWWISSRRPSSAASRSSSAANRVARFSTCTSSRPRCSSHPSGVPAAASAAPTLWASKRALGGEFTPRSRRSAGRGGGRRAGPWPG